jgi:hypothetical protein
MTKPRETVHVSSVKTTVQAQVSRRYSSRRNRTLLLKPKGEDDFSGSKIEEVFGKTFDEPVKSRTLSWSYLLLIPIAERGQTPSLGDL